ncbi:hypothetical protein Hdeb2414_s0503g00906561 [Helianthus debilis subsp. tardiflorus]
MTESNFQLFDPKTFDPRTLIMDSSEDACHHGDFAFAFNDSNYSDRVLRIYIFSESTQSPSGRFFFSKFLVLYKF